MQARAARGRRAGARPAGRAARRADEAGDVYLPGYTHLQRAQPVLLAHHLLAHGWALAATSTVCSTALDRHRRVAARRRCAGRLVAAARPGRHAADLGFARRFENSLDAVGDRDFVAEALFDLTLSASPLPHRRGVVLWTTEEFGFAKLDDAYATGSSMLPQKKNPDIAELARGKAGRLIGDLTGFLATMKGLPLATTATTRRTRSRCSTRSTRSAPGRVRGMIGAVPERMQGR
jgi:argininosuccinate lyase